MTGYGSSKGSENGYTVNVEIRSLNSKFLDANVKLPKSILNRELEVRNHLTAQLVRGKVSLNIEIKKESASAESIAVNRSLFETYYREYQRMAEQVGAAKDELFRLALHSPDVMNGDAEADEDETEWNLAMKYLDLAIEHCDQFRSSEGATLATELQSYIQSIDSNLEKIKLIEPERTKVIKERIAGHVQEISQNDDFDSNRFEQEMIYYIEKLDISEEIVRLGSHLDYFNETMALPEAQGKKLGFISQEIGREINTIGSKANYAPVQRLVVEMKDELEKIKEQLLNVL